MKTKKIFTALLSTLFVLAFFVSYSNQAFAGSATLTWNAVTMNVNSTPITDLAGYKIYYGTTSKSGSTPCANAGYASSIAATTVGNVTSYVVPNLTDGVTYYFAVSAIDTSGNESACSTQQSKAIPAAADTTRPTVTAFVIPATASSLTVAITTFTATDAVGVTGYMVTESATAPTSGATGWTATAPANYTFASAAGSKTLYAWAKDAAGNVSTSLNDVVAITLANNTAPAVTNLVSSNATTSSIQIAWNTDQPADTQVEYGLTSAYGSVSALDSTLTTSHAVTLSNLSASSGYHYRVKSKNAGNLLTTTQDNTFNTLAVASTPTGGGGTPPPPSSPAPSSPSPTVPTSITPSATTVYITPTGIINAPSGVTPGCNNGTVGFSIMTGQSCAGNVSGATVTGNANSATTKKVYNFGTVTLRNGSKGEPVKELQRFLNDTMHLGLVVDGKLGPKTIIVIKKWQKDRGLVMDGLIGKKTKAMMNASVQ